MIKTTFVSRNYTAWGCLSVLPDEVQRFGAKKVLLITDPFLKQNGMAENIRTQLKKIDVETVIYDQVAAEPSLALAQTLVDFTRQQAADLVIGLGGGSAMDLAKLAAVFAVQEGDVKDYLNLSGTRSLSSSGLPKIMIPTTAGTGSEVTNISVLSLENTKDVIAHDYLLADVAIVDAQLTVSVPPRVSAATGIDALTHAIESYVSIYANPITQALSLQAIRLISRALPKAVKNGTDQQAREDLSYGSYLAGIAFFNAGVAGVHALAYPLGGQFHIAHGESNALLLPYVMGYIRAACEKHLKDIYEAMGFSAAYLSQAEAAQACINALKHLLAEVGIPNSLQAFDIPESALDSLTTDACKQTRLLARSPMPLQATDIAKIYRGAWDGKMFD